MSRLGLRVSAVFAATVLAVGVSGCGDNASTAADPVTDPTVDSSGAAPSESASASESESAAPPSAAPVPDWPACAEVWVKGATLPNSYKGCLEGPAPVKAAKQFCEVGTTMITYGDRFWAIRGNTIDETEASLADDAEYQDDLDACKG